MHHAALLPWPTERTTRLDIPHSRAEAVSQLREVLQHFRRNSDAPAVVLVTGACNVTGEIWPIAELSRTAHDFGARVALDAAQLAPHHPVEIASWDVDVALSGHKMYAPYGAGALIGRRDWLDAAPPYSRAGGASHRVTESDVEWAPSPSRHEGGTPNAIGAIALAAATHALSTNGAAWAADERAAHRTIRDGLGAIPGVRVVELFEGDAQVFEPSQPAGRPAKPVAAQAKSSTGAELSQNVGVTTFTVEGYDPTLVAQVLADEYGIAVRDGRFCAHLLCDSRLGEGASAVRASLGLASRREHAQRLVRAVRSIVEDGPRFTYRHLPGVGWEPTTDPRDLSQPRPW